jgi:hypothetical protein
MQRCDAGARFAMKTILIPLDGSILAEQVLPYVGTLAPLL